MRQPGLRSRRRARLVVTCVVPLLATTACFGGSDGETVYTVTITPPPVTETLNSGDDTIVTEAVDTGSSVASTGWAVNTAGCSDRAAVVTPITDTLIIGSVAPQTGGLISAIYKPVVQGFQAYVDQANTEHLLGNVQLEYVVADDAGNSDLTPLAVVGLLDSGADVVSGVVGSSRNLAIRGQLNKACVPQLMALGNSPKLGEVGNAPWTMSGEVPVSVETTIYVNSISRTLGDTSTVGLLVTDDDAGSAYSSSFVTAASETNVGVISQQTVPAASIDPPSTALVKLADKRPDVVVASLAGAACATFLTELAKVRDAVDGWDPTVYMSGSCADPTLLRLAGDAADGVLTSANLKTDDPAFLAAMDDLDVVSGLAAAAEGWNAAEVTVAILIAAAASERGLTRESIIDEARQMSIQTSLARPGVHFTTNGTTDPFAAESLQIVRFEADSTQFVDVGDLVAQFES